VIGGIVAGVAVVLLIGACVIYCKYAANKKKTVDPNTVPLQTVQHRSQDLNALDPLAPTAEV